MRFGLLLFGILAIGSHWTRSRAISLLPIPDAGAKPSECSDEDLKEEELTNKWLMGQDVIGPPICTHFSLPVDGGTVEYNITRFEIDTIDGGWTNQ